MQISEDSLKQILKPASQHPVLDSGRDVAEGMYATGFRVDYLPTVVHSFTVTPERGDVTVVMLVPFNLDEFWVVQDLRVLGHSKAAARILFFGDSDTRFSFGGITRLCARAKCAVKHELLATAKVRTPDVFAAFEGCVAPLCMLETPKNDACATYAVAGDGTEGYILAHATRRGFRWFALAKGVLFYCGEGETDVEGAFVFECLEDTLTVKFASGRLVVWPFGGIKTISRV